MNFRPHPEEEIDVNLTPLIDVVFLLLIFFMVSTTFIRESEIEISLPEASTEVRRDPPNSIEIAIDARGRYFINSEVLSDTRVATIRQALYDARPLDSEPVVIINADARATHQAVIAVMDAARQVGMTQITFPTKVSREK
ncbi:MAG TPA: biopolymer transporter ExbD [Gammaproteobacteria bacterium]|nr:biopolymer transporter ExbD [Gammaproteobacteria bacterium]|tara:strand:- start:933 stop:1352 length:420 start_codon:yes stop_codon:yes gene_type:complete